MPPPNIIVNHAGFPIDGVKRAIFPATDAVEFELQDMMQNDAEAPMGAFENWKTVFRGKLEKAPDGLGDYFTGDFSTWKVPGLYRLTLPGGLGHSLIFGIHDGVLHELPRLFLNYVHTNRCGPFEDERRGPCHLDDGVLDESGNPVDASGGWHDAGDTRKWMVHCTLPGLAFSRWLKRGKSLGNLWREEPWQDDLLAEIAWGARYIPKMQDASTGRIYSDVGGGGDSRRQPGMTWWYENLSGCYADNADNRFTDNRPGSGDERRVRGQYNPLAQYTNIVVLAESADALESSDAALAAEARNAAAQCWRFMRERTGDEYHPWTSVRSWRLQAALAVKAPSGEIDAALDALLELWSPETGFWFMDTQKEDSYRGPLQSAQPLIALAALCEAVPGHPRRPQIQAIIRQCLDTYILPLCGTNPFGIMPYGLFFRKKTDGDHYRPWKNGRYFRFFMPDRSPQKVNSGLGAHWTSWAHAMAYCAEVFELPECRHIALDQLFWLLGNNPQQASFVSGFGYRNPMPHSRAYGYISGGFMNGPRGTAEDQIFADTEGYGDWSTCEYWNPIGANAMLALTHLLPGTIPASRKLGWIPPKRLPGVA